MIEIDSFLLSEANLDGLISQIITRKAVHEGLGNRSLDVKKQQLLQQIQQGLFVIVYDAKNNFYDVISSEDFQKSRP